MSGLKKGGLTVIAGTGLASLLILLVGNSATGKGAQETEGSKQVKEVSVSTTSEASNIVSTDPSALSTSTSEGSVARNTFEAKSITILPPPGPFIEAVNSSNIAQTINISTGDAPIAPKAPMTPVKNLFLEKQMASRAQKPKEPLSSFSLPNKPQNAIAQINILKQPIKSLEVPTVTASRKIKKPIMNKPIKIDQPQLNNEFAPNNPIAPKQQVIALAPQGIVNTRTSRQKPIWMQNIPTKPPLRKMPARPIKQLRRSNINQQNYMQQRVPQRYIVVPAPMYTPNYMYTYPQLPMQGNGYYYAPNLPQNMIAPAPNGMFNFMPITEEKNK